MMTGSLEQATDPDLLARSVTANLMEGPHAQRELIVGLVRFASWLLIEHETQARRSPESTIQLFARRSWGS